MGDYRITTDPKKCIACHVCEVQCKAVHNIPAGVALGKIVVLGPKFVNGVATMSSVFLPCFHCEEAWCLKACRKKAIQRRDKDGLVYIKEESCVGCKACIKACPWRIPQWNPATRKVVKCDMCMERIDQGKEPACVAACPTGALEFGEPGKLSDKTREGYGLDLLEKNLAAGLE
ncbi:MAG: 4Fe-4S binding protein [Deltaproteobacteria bacterium]|nr:4Fe-4S binding protein [Deltaproteobacteria bacterium]